MESPGPRQPLHQCGPCAKRRTGDTRDAAGHFERGAAREGQQQDTARIGALDHQIGDPVRQRAGLAGAGPRDHQQRAGRRGGTVGAVFDGFALRVIELGQPGGAVGTRIGRWRRFSDGEHSGFGPEMELTRRRILYIHTSSGDKRPFFPCGAVRFARFQKGQPSRNRAAGKRKMARARTRSGPFSSLGHGRISGPLSSKLACA